MAEFVGAADFIPGTVFLEGIRTELGLFPNPDGLSVGSAVDVMIRPDDVILTPDPAGSGIVTERLFLGANKVHTFRLPSKLQIRNNQHSAPAISVGTRVAVHASCEHAVAFNPEKSPCGKQAAA